MKKSIVSLLLAGALLCSAAAPAFAAAPVPTAVPAAAVGLEHFKKVNTYRLGTFGDVEIGSWYVTSVTTAYELDLMKGTGGANFSPKGNVTVGSALALACRLHSIYHTGRADFAQGQPWYKVYVDYAVKNGIVPANRFADGDMGKNATRRQFAAILAKALPPEALEAINAVVDGGIPDVQPGAADYAAIYLLYRAGILTGSDKYGTFNPDTPIDRASVAAIVSRMAKADLRKDIALAKPTTVEQVAHAKALEVLSGIPYYGDRSKCRMTAAQAHAYAQLIANGVAGKDRNYPGQSWEEPFQVMGYSGPYQTDRNRAILGDFAGDGNPYLYLRSSKVDGGSFDVYGWQNGKVVRLIDEECWGSRTSSYLEENPDGTVKAVSSGANGAASHGGQEYSFRNGGKVLTYSWDETFNYQTNLWEETINGVKKTYTEEEWNSRVLPEQPQVKLPYPVPDKVPAVSLRALADGLNRYATAESRAAVKPVTVPKVTTAQKIAKAMLKVLDEDAVKDWPRIEAALLFDLNGDGVRELICTGRYSDAAVYYWKNGALQKGATEMMSMAGIEAVVRHKPSNTYGVKTVCEIGGSWTTTYETRTHSLSDYRFTPPDPPYQEERSFTKDGQAITAQKHGVSLKEWEVVKPLFKAGEMLNSQVKPLATSASVRAELSRILAG